MRLSGALDPPRRPDLDVMLDRVQARRRDMKGLCSFRCQCHLSARSEGTESAVNIQLDDRHPHAWVRPRELRVDFAGLARIVCVEDRLEGRRQVPAPHLSVDDHLVVALGVLKVMLEHRCSLCRPPRAIVQRARRPRHRA